MARSGLSAEEIRQEIADIEAILDTYGDDYDPHLIDDLMALQQELWSIEASKSVEKLGF